MSEREDARATYYGVPVVESPGIAGVIKLMPVGSPIHLPLFHDHVPQMHSDAIEAIYAARDYGYQADRLEWVGTKATIDRLEKMVEKYMRSTLMRW